MNKVTAGIIEKDGKFLIAKRKTGKCIGKLWEFPGGKLEEGETLEECLKRELMEELNIEIKIKKYLCSSHFDCENRKIELLAYMVSYISGELKLVDHDDIKWVDPSEFKDFEFVEPDKIIVQKILEELASNN